MATFTLTLSDDEDGIVQLNVSTDGYKDGDPVPDSIKIGGWISAQTSNLFSLFDQLAASVVPEPLEIAD